MNESVTLRTAAAADAAAIHRLIADNLEAGHLLPRSLDDVRLNTPRFVVALIDDAIVGCAELAPLSRDVAEVRSLVVNEAFRGRRIGPSLVGALAAAAVGRGFATLCAFAHEPSHFVRMGFTIVPHIWVPEKIAHDCTTCVLFRRCGQQAVMLPLRAGARVGPERPAAVIRGTRPSARRLELRPASDAAPGSVEAIPA